MTDTLTTQLILSIEHDQRIDLTADGTAVRGYETYIREYVGMLESGLMARMSNAAYKTLHALALRARILGDPRRPGAEAKFQELERLGIVSPEDKGNLFCFPSRERLMDDTGIRSVHTVDAALDELAEMKIVKRVTPAQPRLTRGFFGSNVYIIHPESFIGKFGKGDGEQKVLPVNGDGEQKPLSERPVKGTGSSLRNADNCPLKINNNQHQEEEIKIIVKHFAASIGAERYDPSEKEKRKTAALLAEGYTVEQICTGITSAFERATPTGRKIHSIAYCIPAVREYAIQETERKAEMGSPQPKTVPGQSQAVTQPNPDLEKLAGGDAELRDLLEIVQERNPGRALQKSDVRAWQAVAERFRDLAAARDTTATGLVMQAVLKAVGSHSDRAGYLAPRLAETILEEWQRSEMEKKPQAVQQSPGVESEHRDMQSERRASTAVLPSFETPDGTMEAHQVWELALGELKGQMTKATFDTWVKPTFAADAYAGDAPFLVIGSRNPYAVEWLQHRLHATIQRTVVGIVGKNVTVKYLHVE
jgi:hypothetical protein